MDGEEGTADSTEQKCGITTIFISEDHLLLAHAKPLKKKPKLSLFPLPPPTQHVLLTLHKVLFGGYKNKK
jgi:hypothetical protein